MTEVNIDKTDSDLESIDQRLRQLLDFDHATNYAKQKDSLRKEFEAYFKLAFPNDDGFLFNHIWGKTLRDEDGNVFGVRRNAQVEICPIKGIEHYMEVTRGIRVDLTCGYLFAQPHLIWA